jgi:hypothetical protein
MKSRRAVATAVLVALASGLGVVAGAAGVAMNPTVLCGDTPGFCPNPPERNTQPAPVLACPECGRF